MEFRRSLPAYKEKDAILSAIANNQVVEMLILTLLIACQESKTFENYAYF